MTMRARVPASCANLGPGFDTLAVAIGLYVDVEIEPAESLTIQSEGTGSDLPRDSTHLAARVAADVIGHDRLSIKVKSEIPLSRGLGSSAALSIATAAAAGAEDPIAVALKFAHHPENAAASMTGGLVTTTMVDGKPLATPLFLDPDLAFVLVIPERTFSVEVAREALPTEVPLVDAAFNFGRLGWLIAALGDSDQLRPEVMEDRIHQTRRAHLFPEAEALLAELVAGGAAAACWSGTGPSLLALCIGNDKAQRVRRAGEKALANLGIEGEVRIVEPDMAGLHVE